jgi:hypothetical protein
MMDPIHSELRTLHNYLADASQPWSISIGHLIPCSLTSISLGDASQVAGGAYCEPLCFWFDIMWSAYVRDALHLHHKHPRHLHINCLEFVIIILQLAAVITLFESSLPPEVLANFPNGVPSIPNHLALTDNMSSKAWANKVCTSSVRGQMLLSIYAALLCRTYIGFNCDHLPGIDNPIADMISRPDANRYTTGKSERYPGAISNRVPNSCQSSSHDCPPRYGWTPQNSQRPWDDS